MKSRNRFGSLLPTIALFAVAPLAFANSGAPPFPGLAGVPTESTCAQSGCHVGTLNPTGGSVEVVSLGTTYVPGQEVRLTVRINDSTARIWGFQMTARLTSTNTKTQAGVFKNADTSTFVYCSDAAFSRVLDDPAGGCPTAQPLQHIQHAGAKSGATNNTFTVLWTPPASGEATIYVVGNAANANGLPTGDRIFTANYKLTAATGGGATRPTVSTGGVIGAGSFSGKAEISSGTWIEIYGKDFATATRSWAGTDFQGANAPTALDGVRVSIGGKPAFVALISPGQINVQAPADLGVGPAVLTVTNANGTSDNVTIDVKAKTPALLAPPAFKVNNKQYLAALYADGATFVGPANFIAGVASRPARAGDTFITYGIGFGSVSPAIAPGTIVGAANALPNMRVLFGQTAATVSYAGLAPNFVGLYQFNIVVPNGLTAGDVPISFTVDGTAAQTDLVTTVQ